MAAVTVRVTATDIRLGRAGDPLACPVARALLRETGLLWSACPRVLRVVVFGGKRSLPAPGEAEAFMRAYDRGQQVCPSWFTLDVPDGWLPRGRPGG